MPIDVDEAWPAGVARPEVGLDVVAQRGAAHQVCRGRRTVEVGHPHFIDSVARGLVVVFLEEVEHVGPHALDQERRTGREPADPVAATTIAHLDRLRSLGERRLQKRIDRHAGGYGRSQRDDGQIVVDDRVVEPREVGVNRECHGRNDRRHRRVVDIENHVRGRVLAHAVGVGVKQVRRRENVPRRDQGAAAQNVTTGQADAHRAHPRVWRACHVGVDVQRRIVRRRAGGVTHDDQRVQRDRIGRDVAPGTKGSRSQQHAHQNGKTRSDHSHHLTHSSRAGRGLPLLRYRTGTETRAPRGRRNKKPGIATPGGSLAGSLGSQSPGAFQRLPKADRPPPIVKVYTTDAEEANRWPALRHRAAQESDFRPGLPHFPAPNVR